MPMPMPMPRPETRASPSSAGTLLSTVMLLAIIFTTTWLRTGVAHDIVRRRRPHFRRPRFAPRRRRRSPFSRRPRFPQSRAHVRLACVAAAPPLAAAPLTASYKGAAVGATAVARSNGDPTPSPSVLPHLLQNQILTPPHLLPESGAIDSFPSDELCGIVPLGGFQTYSKMDAYRNRQKFNRHNNIIAREDERLLLKVHKGWRDFG